MRKQEEVINAERAMVGTNVAGRMAGEDRRNQIVHVAMRLFSERGFRGTTTKEIARAAGVSEAIIFRHFATKEELYAAILDTKSCAGNMSQLSEMFAEAVKRGDDRAVFESVALTMLQHHEEDEDFLRLLLYSALEGHELFQMFWQRNVRELADFLRSYVRERQKAGALREMEPRLVGRAFTGMILHQSLINNLFDKSRTLLDITNERAAREFTKILLYGTVSSSAPEAEVKKRNETATRKR
ncbi:MAG: TetR/AcrR family transcriptional regulator [Pyrinomonadaceae bacterium]|nr:TetR/AcrR family transcriptional regulator [Pyrinomonadaceae bacterium]